MAKEKRMSVPRIEYWRNKKREYNWRLVGKNSLILCSSNQGFKQSNSMAKNILAILHCFYDDSQVIHGNKIEITVAGEGSPYQYQVRMPYQSPVPMYRIKHP